MDDVPATLWAYIALSGGSALVALALELFKHRPWLGFVAIVFEVVFIALLLRRVRLVWWFLVVFGGLALLLPPYTFSWWRYISGTAGLVLLLMPATRHYLGISRPRRRPRSPSQIQPDPDSMADSDRPAGWAGGVTTASETPQQTRDPRQHSDADRPRGWYVDPERPRKMRYWAGPETGWTGSARTPRKLRGTEEDLTDP